MPDRKYPDNVNPAASNKRLPIFESILTDIIKRKRADKAFVVGISGIDGAGKTKFAESLEEFLIARDYTTQMIAIDDFHNPQADRYAGDNQADNYYNRSFNIDLIVEKLLLPLQQGNAFSIQLTLLDWHTDKYDIEKTYSFDQKTIAIIEGVFLFRKGLSPYIDYKIFLEIPFEESKRRALFRDATVSEAELRKYDEKYVPAQRKYLAEFPPSEIADMIIDNVNWESPYITFTSSK
jgi:uridine kinase